MKEVRLYGPKADGRVTLVDDMDYESVMQYPWHIHEVIKDGRVIGGPYAVATVRYPELPRGRQTLLHTFLTGWPLVDHKDGNGLNNQRQNLRPATQAENLRNARKRTTRASSQYKGVSWMARRQVWVAMIWDIGKNRYLGSFQDEADAARAYNLAARDAFGEFAYLNDVEPRFPV